MNERIDFNSGDGGAGERQLRRVAGGLAVAGAVLMIPLQATAAAADEPGDIASYFVHVLGGSYQAQYLAIAVVALLMALGLAGIAATLRNGPAAGWAIVAMISAAFGGALAVLTGVVAGVALPPVVAAWDASGQEATAFAVASGVWWIVRAGFIAFVLTLLGATIASLGLAVAGDGRHPAWLGWLGAAIGLAAMVVAIILGVQGPGVPVEQAIFPIVAMAAMLWVLALGVLTWRSAGRPAVRQPGNQRAQDAAV